MGRDRHRRAATLAGRAGKTSHGLQRGGFSSSLFSLVESQAQRRPALVLAATAVYLTGDRVMVSKSCLDTIL